MSDSKQLNFVMMSHYYFGKCEWNGDKELYLPCYIPECGIKRLTVKIVRGILK